MSWVMGKGGREQYIAARFSRRSVTVLEELRKTQFVPPSFTVILCVRMGGNLKGSRVDTFLRTFRPIVWLRCLLRGRSVVIGVHFRRAGLHLLHGVEAYISHYLGKRERMLRWWQLRRRWESRKSCWLSEFGGCWWRCLGRRRIGGDVVHCGGVRKCIGGSTCGPHIYPDLAALADAGRFAQSSLRERRYMTPGACDWASLHRRRKRKNKLGINGSALDCLWNHETLVRDLSKLATSSPKGRVQLDLKLAWMLTCRYNTFQFQIDRLILWTGR